MPASYQSSMTVPAPRNEVFEACLKAVPQAGFRLLQSNPEAGQIQARASMGLRSWGENISISVGPDGRVDVRSACRGIQMIDYGKNKSNVSKLFAALGPLLPQAQQ